MLLRYIEYSGISINHNPICLLRAAFLWFMVEPPHFRKRFIHLYTDLTCFFLSLSWPSGLVKKKNKNVLCSHTFHLSWETQSSFLVCSHFLFHISMCVSSCQKRCSASLNVSLLRPPLFAVIWKSRELKVVTQDHLVSPLSLSLTQGCIIIIALCDSHTASLRANASWQLFLHTGPWALVDAGGLSLVL